MTRKDFELIAQTLWNGYAPIAGADAVRDAIHSDYCRAFADALATTNTNFNRERFLKACGLEG